MVTSSFDYYAPTSVADALALLDPMAATQSYWLADTA